MPIISSKYVEVEFAKYLMLLIYIPMNVANGLVHSINKAFTKAPSISYTYYCLYSVMMAKFFVNAPLVYTCPRTSTCTVSVTCI